MSMTQSGRLDLSSNNAGEITGGDRFLPAADWSSGSMSVVQPLRASARWKNRAMYPVNLKNMSGSFRDGPAGPGTMAAVTGGTRRRQGAWITFRRSGAAS